jgi:ankyrin repeat protein
LIDELVAKGANINAKDEHNLTPILAALDDNDLGDAMSKNQEEIILHLMSQPGADLRARMPETQNTPLHLACSAGYPRVLEKLLALDSSLVNEEIEGGRTALHLAAESESVSTVKILLTAAGVVVDKADAKGETALSLALQAENLEITRALLEAKANPNAEVNNEPLLHSTISLKNSELVALLIEFKVNVKQTSVGGSGSLHKVALNGCMTNIANLLITAGADVNARDEKGFTPLYIACGFTGSEDLVISLISHGADVKIKSNGDATPLHAAAHKGLIEVMQYLLSAGAEVNAVTKSGKTPLKLAMDNKKTQAAEFLLLNGSIN